MNHRLSLLDKYNSEINKEAQLTSILSSIADSIISSIQELYANTKENPVATLSQFFLQSVISYAIGPWWAILAAVLSEVFDLNINKLFEIIKSVVLGFVSNKSPESISPEQDSHQLATSVLQNLNIPQDDAQRSLEDVIASRSDSLIKEAKDSKGFFLKNPMGKFSVFSIVKTIIFAILKGFAISAVAKVGVDQIRGVPPKSTTTTTSSPPKSSIVTYLGQPSSFGMQSYTNDADINGYGNKAWYIDVKSNLADTIMSWIESVYPNMPDKVYNVMSNNFSSKIGYLYDIFGEWNIDKNINKPNRIRVPNKYKSIRQIVDEFLSAIPA